MGSLFGYGFSPWGYGGFDGYGRGYGGYGGGFSPFQGYGGYGGGGMDYLQALFSQLMQQQPQAPEGATQNGVMMPTPQNAKPDPQPQGLPPDVYGISPTEMPQFAPPSPDVYGISPIEQPAQPPPAPMVTSQAGPQMATSMATPPQAMPYVGRGGYGGGKGMNRGG